MGAKPLNAPIVAVAATPDGGGYWEVAADGGVFAFGDAPFYGSMGAKPLNRPIVAAAATGGGYLEVASDGGVFAFGGAPYDGSMGGKPLHRPIIGAAAVAGGYYLLGSDGGVFTFGTAPFYGTAPGPPLAGTTIVLDPGHDGGNGADPAYINQPIWNGVEEEACDTVGAETAGGYPENLFNWNVAQYLRADLVAQGARVILTRDSNTGVGPCVNERAAIGNEAEADAAVSIHADGGPVSGRGFAVLTPVADGINNAVVPASDQDRDADQYLRRCRRPPAEERPRRAESHHGAQGPDRMRQHGQRHRRVTARPARLAAAGRSGDRRRPLLLPRRLSGRLERRPPVPAGHASSPAERRALSRRRRRSALRPPR
jgi:N-acetylmuramoyl-L-alanine amidase